MTKRGEGGDRPRRLLVSMKIYLGDAVMTAPLLDAAEAAGWETTLLTAPVVAKALGRSRTLPYVRTRWLRDTVGASRTLRAGGFDACVLVNRSIRAALIARLAGIPIRIGHPVEGRRPLLTHPVAYDPNRFEAATIADLGAPLGLTVPDVHPKIVLSQEERAKGDELRAGADLAIQPGARYELKRIPPDRLQEAAQAWQREGRRIVLVGGPEEKEDADSLMAGLNEPVVNLVGHCGIRETMAALAGVRVAVGADTGVMHLAVAVGCPTVQVFGPTPMEKWGHAYAPHRVLAAPEGDMTRITAEMLRAAVEGR